MANTIQCDIVSAQESIFSGNVEMLTATATNGELGIMAGHAPMLAGLAPGPVNIRLENGQEEVFFVSGGYLEVQPKKISILADTAERAHDMDEAAAERARSEAERELENRSSEVEYSHTAARLAEAAGQLRTLKKFRRKSR